MIHAYDEMYVDSAMNNLGDAFDYVASDLNMDKDEFLKLFISTGIADEFGTAIQNILWECLVLNLWKKC